MALLDLYYDTISKELLHGLSGPAGFHLPPLRQEEGLTIALNVVKRANYFAGGGAMYQRINVNGYGLQISVSDVSAVATVLASQNSWTVSDPLGLFEGVLPLNTSGINALSDNAKIYFEIRLFDGTYYSGKRFPTTVEKAVAVVGSPQVIAGDTALGSLEAQRVYLLKNGSNGEGRIWRSEDGLQVKFQYLHNDGTLHLDEIV